MKKGLLAILIAFISLSGCKKIDELTQFEIDVDTKVTIPATADINLPFDVSSPDIPTNSYSTFAANQTRKDLVDEIVLKKFDLSLKSPQNGDFGFLKSIEIFIEASGLPELKVAWAENLPESVGNYLKLQTSSADLKEYIKLDEFSLRVKTVTDEVITYDHEIDVLSTYFVDAKIFGQ